MITISLCGSRRSKGVPSGSAVILRRLVGSWGPPNVPKVSPIASGYTRTEFCYTARKIWTKDVWKRTILRTDVLSHQMSSLRLYPKSPPKPHFGGHFSANPIIERALRKSHVNGATKLKHYSYIHIGKYCRVCQNFCARGRPGGGAGPPNVNLGHSLVSRKLLELESRI